MRRLSHVLAIAAMLVSAWGLSVTAPETYTELRYALFGETTIAKIESASPHGPWFREWKHFRIKKYPPIRNWSQVEIVRDFWWRRHAFSHVRVIARQDRVFTADGLIPFEDLPQKDEIPIQRIPGKPAMTRLASSARPWWIALGAFCGMTFFISALLLYRGVVRESRWRIPVK